MSSRADVFFQAEAGIRDYKVTGVQTCALPIFSRRYRLALALGACTALFASSAFAQDISVTFGQGGGLTERVLQLIPPLTVLDRKSVVEGKSVDVGGSRIIKKKKTAYMSSICLR